MRRSALIAAAALAICCAGCGAPVHPREVEQLQLVQTLGYDSDGDTVTVSVSSGRALGGGSAALLSAQGASVTDAIRNLQSWSAREELFFAHVRFAVVGETAAREGIAPVLDFFERNTQTALDLPLFIVRGATARELIAASPDPEYEVTALLASLTRDAERMGTEHCFTVLEAARQLGRSGAALCPAVRPAPAAENAPSAEEGATALLPAGYGVLRGGALVGFLDEEEALGTDLLLGLSGQSCYVLPCGEGRVTVELRSSRADITPCADGAEGPGALIGLVCRAGIVEAEGVEDLTGSALPTLSAALAQRIDGQIAAALSASARLGTDFLELGRRLGIPGMTHGLPASLRWRTQVTAVIERSYDIGRSEDLTGGGQGHG